MRSIRTLARALLPPLLVELAPLRPRIVWGGDYGSWADAVAASGGYGSEEILNQVERAALAVKRGEAVYERDSVLFDEIVYSWPLLSGLLWVAARHGGRLEVVDFGGALGSTYFQNRDFLTPLVSLRWHVVEQAGFVERGRRSFQDDRLRFHDSLDACLAEHTPSVLVLSGALQYLERPYELVAGLDRFPFVVVDLTPVHGGSRDRLTVQKVPPSIYPARYPCWFFSEEKLLAALRQKHRLIAAFDSHIGQGVRVGWMHANYRGYILERSV